MGKETVDLVLDFLRRGSYVSGQEISRALGISRNGVNKHIKALRALGYDIDSATNRGYCLIKEPDEISEVEIEKQLKTAYIGRPTRVLCSVDSTNEEIKRCAFRGKKQGLVVVSDEQTAGRGRFGRAWESPRGNGIYESILLRPDIPPTQISCITLVAGLAVCRAVNELCACNALIKWPNDVIIGRKKLCGILTEMTIEDNFISFVVVGLGINVNNLSFSDEICERATSLRLESGAVFSRNEVIAKIANCFERAYDEFIISGFGPLKAEYKSYCATIGRSVSAICQGQRVKGTAVDVAPDGGLVVEADDGGRKCISTGEVTVQGIY